MSLRLLPAFAALIVCPMAGVLADITFDPATHSATLSDDLHTLTLHLRLDDRCLIDSVTVLGRQVASPQTGLCTAVKVGGEWHTTRENITSLRTTVDGSRLRITDIRYGPADFPVTEEWVFIVAHDHIDWEISRTYQASGELQDTYFPGFDFAGMETWTGGILDTGGVAWTKYLDTPVASYGSHTGAVTFWNKNSQDCLKITTKLSNVAKDVTARFSRHPTGVFAANFWPSDTPLEPAHGLARFLTDRQDVWRPTIIAVDAAHPLTITNTVTLAALPLNKFSNLGTLKGLDGKAVRELLNTIARYGVIDRGIAGGNGWRSSFVCTHEPWTAQYGMVVDDPAMIANFSRTLDEWQRIAITPEGRVLGRWHNDDGDAMPGTFDLKSGYYEAQWGYMLDSQPSYVVCVAEQFDLTGDLPWLRSHRDSCRAALEYMLKRDSDGDGLLEVIPKSHKEEKGSDWIDIVWASHENALVNAEMFEAMTRWAGLEELMGDAAKAGRYRDAAAKLKAAFNRSIADGGFWNPERNWYVYWREADDSIHGDNLVTPVNFAAIAYGICDDPTRRKAILDQIETLMQKENLFHWPLCFYPFNPDDVYIRQKSFPVYENGDLFLSWAEVATRAYVKTDPTLAVKYIKKVIDRYNVDGLSFQRCLRGNAEGSGDDILAGNAMAIVGLYRDVYGIKPRHDRLFVDQHITPELGGTRLFYTLRGKRYTIDLEEGSLQVGTDNVSVWAVQPFGIDIEKGTLRYFPTIDGPAQLTITSAAQQPMNITGLLWSIDSRDPRRLWTIQSPSGGLITLHHVIAGLPKDSSFVLRRNDQVAATLRSSPEGAIEFDTERVAGGTRFSLEADKLE